MCVNANRNVLIIYLASHNCHLLLESSLVEATVLLEKAVKVVYNLLYEIHV